jgi:hypothetical protein
MNRINICSNKNRVVRRRRQSSGSLPPFYTGIFESDDEKFSYINYQLPFDIYWFSQKQVITSSKSPNQNKKKKQELSYKNFSRNTHINSPIQQISNKILNTLKMEELTPHEKQIVSQTSIFLKRNLQRIKEKRELKDKNNNQQKQHIDEQPLPLFFSQNYYHPNITISELNSSYLSHKGKYLHRSVARRGVLGVRVSPLDKKCLEEGVQG